MHKLNSKDDWNKLSGCRVVEVPLPDLDAMAYVRSINQGERIALEAKVATPEWKEKYAEFTVAACLCDEHGNPIEVDLDTLTKKDSLALITIATAALNLNKMSAESIADEKKS